MKKVKLTGGKTAFVDDADYDAVNKYKWSAQLHGCVWRARRSIRVNGTWKSLMLHRAIMGRNGNKFIDHIDLNPLNCTRDNMRWCSPGQSQANRGVPKNNTSGYKGVHRSRKKWGASIVFCKKHKWLGVYMNIEDAARAYNEAAIKYHGKFARLNTID